MLVAILIAIDQFDFNLNFSVGKVMSKNEGIFDLWLGGKNIIGITTFFGGEVTSISYPSKSFIFPKNVLREE